VHFFDISAQEGEMEIRTNDFIKRVQLIELPLGILKKKNVGITFIFMCQDFILFQVIYILHGKLDV
jgi:hypothetical protein